MEHSFDGAKCCCRLLWYEYGFAIYKSFAYCFGYIYSYNGIVNGIWFIYYRPSSRILVKTCNMDTCVASSNQTEYVENDTLQSHITQRQHDYSGIKESLLESLIMYFSILAGLSLIRLCDKKLRSR